MKLIPTVLILGSLLVSQQSQAGSATWNIAPRSGNWNSPNNWTPTTVPNGPADVATFGQSNATAISLTEAVEVNAISFEPGASAFSLTVPNASSLTVSGQGISNNSGITQSFIAVGDTTNIATIQFSGSATAGDLMMFFNKSDTFTGYGQTIFLDDSTAGTATFINQTYGSSFPGRTQFFDRSSAGHGTFINSGGGGETIFMGDSTAADGTFIINGAAGPPGKMCFFENSNAGNGNFTLKGPASGETAGGNVTFSDTASAANGTFTVNDAAVLIFSASSTIGDATVIANGGSHGGGIIYLVVANTGGTARVQLFDNGTLFTQRDLSGVSIGSLEGNGIVDLGRHNPLIIGTNNLSTTFSGTIIDNGLLEKVGNGTLTLSGANTYTGTTTVKRGTLLATNLSGSATGTGNVEVSAGTLGGNGTITGTVLVGTGSGLGAFLAPAAETVKKRTLTLQQALVLNSDATYTYTFRAKANKARADLVIANGITINGATIDLEGIAVGALTPGLTLTLLSNTSANPISGTFINLPDGGIVTVGSNNFQANYEGGDGNDLTLTVVP